MLAFFTTVEADILSEVTIYSRIMASAYRRIVERTLAPSADMGYALLLHNYSRPLVISSECGRPSINRQNSRHSSSL